MIPVLSQNHSNTITVEAPIINGVVAHDNKKQVENEDGYTGNNLSDADCRLNRTTEPVIVTGTKMASRHHHS